MPEPIIPTRSREKIAADNRAELDAWIDERAESLVAQGMTAQDARTRALAEFGDIDTAERYARNEDVIADRRTRRLFWLEELVSDVRIAARTFARTPTVTAVILLTFALGVGATTAVFSVVHAMLMRALPYADEQTLVYLPAVDNGVISPGLGGARHSGAAYVALRERTTSFTAIAGATTSNAVFMSNGDPEQIPGASLTPNGFDVLGARAAIGRTFRPEDETADVVILMDVLWRRRFGADPSIIGRTIELSIGRRQVIGVMPPDFRVPTYEQAEWAEPQSLTNILADPNDSQVRFMRLFGRVKPGVSQLATQTDVERTMRSLQAENPQSFRGIDTRVLPIRTAVAGDATPRLLVLMSAAAFLLLIACANVAGILLSRAYARRHELSIRVALGAGRRRLIRQFLADGAVLATVGAALGLLIAQLGILVLRRIAALTLPVGTSFSLEPRVVTFALGVAVAAALVAALFPALGGTRSISATLRSNDGRVSATRANRSMRLALVAGQLAVSVVLLVGAGLFLRTLQQLSKLDLGYATERALTFKLQYTRPHTDEEQDAFWDALYPQLRAIPGVIAVGGGNMPMTAQSTIVGLEIEGRTVDRERRPEVRYTPASDDYFTALGVPILRGRAFNATDRTGAPRVAIISNGLAKQLWPDGDPMGARVKAGPDNEWTTVIGIAGDVRMGGADTPQPSIYTSQRQDHWRGGGAVVLRTKGDPTTVAASIRQALNRVDPSMPIIGLTTLEEFRRTTPAFAERRMLMQLMAMFAVVALVVSAIGVFGVGSYATEARRREFGIRMALGASRKRVLLLALRDSAHVAVLGAVVGVPLAWLLATRVRGMFFAIAPFDPLTIVVVLGALVIVVFAASIVPARRATLIDPAHTMRTD